MSTPPDEGFSAEGTLTASSPLEALPPPSESLPSEPFPPRGRERYLFEGEHARGGLGRISKVFDRDLGRVVAIKELLAETPGGVQRFAREARITARLEHPSIVPVHDLGQWSTGEPFYAMKLVSGRTLKDLIAETGQRERQRLVPHVLAVADAIAYAHSRSVVHRDLKPSNVLVGSFGETIVIDWGLAKTTSEPDDHVQLGVYRTETIAALTRVGSIVGTPAYMPPEQASGLVVDQRADVYALGAMLYHVLSGVPPYQGLDSQKLLEHVLAGPPAPLDRAFVPRDLIAIVERAMARDPAARYLDAALFADDLKRYVTGQLVTAQSYRVRDLVQRWVNRNLALVVASTVFIFALAFVTVLAFRGVLDERNIAQNQRALAEKERTAAQERADQLVLLQARSELAHDPTAALAWLSQYPVTAPDQRGARAIAADALARGAAGLLFDGVIGMSHEIAPDGRHVVAITEGGRAVLLDVRDGRTSPVVARLNDKGPLVWSPDGRWFLGQELGAGLSLFDREKLMPVRLSTSLAEEARAAFSPDSAQVAVMEGDGKLTVFDVETRAPLHATKLDGGVGDLTFSTDGTTVIISQAAGVRAVQTKNGEMRQLLESPIRGSAELVVSGDRRRAILSHGPNLYIADLERVEVRQLVGEKGTLTLRPDGGYEIAHAEQRDPLSLPSAITAEAISADGALVIAASDPGVVRVWDVAHGSSFDLQSKGEAVAGLVLADDGGWLAIYRYDHIVSRWTRSGDQFRHLDDLRLTGGTLQELMVTPAGELVVSLSSDHQLRVWTDATRVFSGWSFLSWASNSAILYTGKDGNTNRGSLNDGESENLGRCKAARSNTSPWSNSSFSDRVVACIGDDQFARVLDLHRKTLTPLSAATDVTSVLASGPRVLVRRAAGIAELVDVETGQIISKDIGQHPAIAQDGSAVAWTVGDSVKIWNTETGSESSISAKSQSRYWLPGRGRFLVVKYGGKVDVWTAGGDHIGDFSGVDAKVWVQDISPSGAFVAIASTGVSTAIWDVHSHQRLVEVPSSSLGLGQFVDETHFVAAVDVRLFLVDIVARTARVVHTAKRDIRNIDSRPDGRVAAGASDGSVAIVDVASPTPRVMEGAAWALNVRFSPDGRYVANGENSSIAIVRPDDLPFDGPALHAELAHRSQAHIAPDGQVQGVPLP
jgi:WD40 repeat protein